MPCIRRTPEEREAYEVQIHKALYALRSNKYKTPGAAARAFDVDPKTLRDRWLGRRKDNTAAHLAQPLLTVAQEEALVSWCIYLSLLATPLDRDTIGSYVHAICGVYPSSSWVEQFLRKHSDVLVLRSTSGIDPKLARAFNKPTVDCHFKLFESVMKEHGIPPEKLYNMDEKGIQLGGGRKRNGRKFICWRAQRTNLKLRDSNLELATIVECISADGQALPPGFILSGASGNYNDQWFERKGVGSIATSPNGWTDDELTYLWFVKVFVPFAQARNHSGKPIILVMDGHGSHCTDKMREYGYSCQPRVHIYLLPPHTTHRLQPLDSSVFGVAQRSWSKLCDQRTMEGKLVTRDTVVSEWMDLRSTFLKEDIIFLSWRQTGLSPLNPNIFRDDDFAPSHIFSVKSHLPAWYPSLDSTELDSCDSDEEPEQREQPIIKSPQGGVPSIDQGLPDDTQFDSTPVKVESQTLTINGALPLPGTRLHTKPQLTTEIARLRDYIARLEARVESSEAHAMLMAKRNEELQKTMNTKTKKRNGKKLTTDARLVTSDKYMALRRKEVEEEGREAERMAEKVRMRELELGQRQRNRVESAHTTIWNAGWRNRKKEDLKDLCYVLGLSTDGTRNAMIERVETHLAGHPFLANDNRFGALYSSRVTDEAHPQVTVT